MTEACREGVRRFLEGQALMALSFRSDRGRRAGRFLEWKVRIFAAGAVLGLAGIFLDERG